MPGHLQRARTAVTALGLLLASAAPAGAAAASPAADSAAGTVSASDITSVTAALVAAGYPARIAQADDGGTYVLVSEGDAEFAVSFDDCEDSVATIGCNLLIFNASWEGSDGDDHDVANDFNQSATLAHAFVDSEGSLNLTLAVTTSGGLPAENFADILARWQAADEALSALVEAAPAASSGTIIATLNVP